MNEKQIERFRQIVQEVATDECITFDEAFTIASNHLAYWVSEMPKGRASAGGGSSHSSKAAGVGVLAGLAIIIFVAGVFVGAGFVLVQMGRT